MKIHPFFQFELIADQSVLEFWTDPKWESSVQHTPKRSGSLSRKLLRQHFFTLTVFLPNTTRRALQKLNHWRDIQWYWKILRGRCLVMEFCKKWWRSIFRIFSFASEIFLLSSTKRFHSKVILRLRMLSEIHLLPVQKKNVKLLILTCFKNSQN